MFGHAGQSASAASLPGWTLLFAREPEPDPDLEDIPGGPQERMRAGAPPLKPQKSPRRTPIVLLLLLAVVAGVAYLSMNMDMLSGLLPESVTDLLGEAPPPPGLPAPPAPGEGPSPVGPLASKPFSAPDERSPSAPPSPMAPSAPIQPAAPPAPAAPLTPGQPAMPGLDFPPAGMKGDTKPATPLPRFGEGQRVMVAPDPMASDKALSLSGDAAGTKPGPMLRPGAVVTVLDGELQNNAWVYSVQTPDGAKGWIPEHRLRSKP